MAEKINNPTAQATNGEIRCGDYVIAIDNNCYFYLVGKVIEILKHGTPEHAEETDNGTDSVHVDFKAFPYPPWREIDIAEYFNALGNSNEVMLYDDLSLDDVIMAPDMLIRITELGEDKINDLVCDYDEAKSFCEDIISNLFVIYIDNTQKLNKSGKVFKKVNKNSEVYYRYIMLHPQREGIVAEGKISVSYCKELGKTLDRLIAESHGVKDCYRWSWHENLDRLKDRGGINEGGI